MLNQQMTNLMSYDGNNNLMQELSYTYDNVSNITQIQNTASSISNGLGGNYNYSYTYDNLYRLTNASGSFTPQGMPQISQSLTMQYSASGNISSKAVTATTLNNSTTTSINYSNTYSYNGIQPHAVSQVGINSYLWDDNGNMIQSSENSNAGVYRNLCWDEENRLMGVTDYRDNIPNSTSAYIYNAGGERVWKFTGHIEQMSINGDELLNVANITDKTLYSSPYLVVNGQNYTKHYFAGSERICSKIGGGFADNPISPTGGRVVPLNGDEVSASDDFKSLIDNSFGCSSELPEVIIEPQLFGIEDFIGTNETENLLYFYHTDHLGSSSFITDLSGSAVQHLQYMPFGESFVNQTSTSWDARYKFTGKERDSETGFDYFGARYYDSDLSVWLSVDPMSVLSPGVSSYAYVNNNPIMLIDEWGLTPGPIKRFKSWIKRVKRGIRTTKVPYEKYEITYKDPVVFANGQVNGSIDNKGDGKEGTEVVKGRRPVHQRYFDDAKSVKFSFSGTGTDGITITQSKGKGKEKTVFTGKPRETDSDWIKLRGNRQRNFSINFEWIFTFTKKGFEVYAYYKSYKVSAIVKMQKSKYEDLKKRGIIE